MPFKKSISITIFFLVIIFYSLQTVRYNYFWQDAGRFYERLTRLSSGSFAGFNNLGVVYESKARYADAVLNYRRALNIEPDFPEAYINLARVYFKTDKVDEARKIIEEVIEKYPEQHRAFYLLAGMYVEEKDFLQAITFLKKAISINSQKSVYHNELAYLYKRIGDLDKAIEEYKLAIELDRDNPVYHNDLGLCFKDKGLLGEAIQEYIFSIRLKPLAASFNNLANLLSQLAGYEEAVKLFSIAIDMEPSFIEARYNLAVTLFKMQRFDEANLIWQEILEEDKDFLPAKAALENLNRLRN